MRPSDSDSAVEGVRGDILTCRATFDRKQAPDNMDRGRLDSHPIGGSGPTRPAKQRSGVGESKTWVWRGRPLWSPFGNRFAGDAFFLPLDLANTEQSFPIRGERITEPNLLHHLP
jgi:hypothetical protein